MFSSGTSEDEFPAGPTSTAPQWMFFYPVSHAHTLQWSVIDIYCFFCHYLYIYDFSRIFSSLVFLTCYSDWNFHSWKFWVLDFSAFLDCYYSALPFTIRHGNIKRHSRDSPWCKTQLSLPPLFSSNRVPL